jgi:hypothetical protein
LGLLAALVVLALVPTSAQGPLRARQVQGSPTTLAPLRVAPIEDSDGAFRAWRGSARGVTIHGIVVNHVGMLVPKAGVIVIRRLADGEPVGQTEVDALAQFTLRGFDPGTYAAELVDRGGSVIATSGAFSAGIGEVIQLAPVIPAGSASGLASMIGSATDGALNSAVSAGLNAVSAGLPVSPR